MSEETTETTANTADTTNVAEAPRVMPADQVAGLIARETAKAAEKAQADLLAGLGVSDLDQAKTALDAFKASQEASKTAEQKLAELQAEREGLVGKASKLEQSVKSFLDAQIASVPEDKRGLIPEFDDPSKTLEWIGKNQQFLTAPAQVTSAGTAVAPGAALSPTVTLEEFNKMNLMEKSAFQKANPELFKAFSAKGREKLNQSAW